MYAGEVTIWFGAWWRTLTGVVNAQVNVAQEQLPAFLKTAEKLKIKGLAEGTQGSDNWEDFVKQVYIEIKSMFRDLYSGL